jgi:hypothetical protein
LNHRPSGYDAASNLLKTHPRTRSLYVFPGRGGQQRTDIKHQVNRIKDDAGLPKDFRALHGLRHTYASMLASSGEVGMYTLQKWQISDFELFKWIKNGLQPYNEHGFKIVDPTTDFGRKIMSSFKRKPDFGHINKKLPESMLKPEDETEFRQHLAVIFLSGWLKANNCEADLFDIPANKSKGDALIRRMKKWLFKTSDVFKFEKGHGLYKSSKILPCDPGTKCEDIKIIIKYGQ